MRKLNENELKGSSAGYIKPIISIISNKISYNVYDETCQFIKHIDKIKKA